MARASIGGSRRDEMRKFKFTMIAYYAVIIIGITVFISISTVRKTDDVLKSKVAELTNQLNVQMQMNLDSYLARVETMATLVFAEKETYTYDATDPANDEYEALNTENAISDRLYSICLMENFVDFSIVYRDNHTVGKLSNNTKELFGDKLYEDLSAIINRERTRDGWLAGYSGNYNRIYYVKRVNDNAVLLTSFYAAELESVFEHPGGMSDLTVRLVEDNDVMLYSSENGSIGAVLGEELRERVEGLEASTFIDDDYLITVSPAGDNWRVICSVPTQIILREQNAVQMFVLSIGVLAAVIAIVLSMVLSFGISSSVEEELTDLGNLAEVDQLTGILNKAAFEEKAATVLERATIGAQYAVILFDIDNFKSVNDTYGHAFGDKVLAGAGEIMRRTFKLEDYLGRLGGDEFCVLLSVNTGLGGITSRSLVEKKCSELCTAFAAYDFGPQDFKATISVGAALYPESGKAFTPLYKAADSALYTSKGRGKNTYTISGEESV